ELDDRVATGRRSRKANRAHRGLGAARNKAQHLDVWHAGNDQLRQLELELRRDAETRAVTHDAIERVENGRRRVAEDERTPGEDVVDVFVVIDVPDARAGSLRDNERLSANSTERPDR